MKIFILVLSITLLVFIFSFGTSKKENDKTNSINLAVKKSVLPIDTFTAIRRIFPAGTVKAAAEDTVILIIHGPSSIDQRPPVSAGSQINFEVVRILHPFKDPPSSKAAADTIVLKAKPYKRRF